MKPALLKLFLLVALLVSGLVACGGSEATQSTLKLSLVGVTRLEGGFTYEGWAVVAGKTISTGKFNVDASGALVTAAGALIPNGEVSVTAAPSSISAVVITIEPANDTDPSPSATHLLAGAVADGKATLLASAPEALNSTFSTAKGKYLLAAPTGPSGTNPLSGLWFVDNSSGAGEAGLILPTLPAGFSYEGWVVLGGKPLSTGKFTLTGKADLAASYSGSSGTAPPFPGEDFLSNAPAGLTFPTNLQGAKLAISIEPEPDDSPAPYSLKPLSGSVPANAVAQTNYSMTDGAAALPTATVTIR